MTTMPEALSAYIAARAEDGAPFTTEEVVAATGFVAVRHILGVLAQLGASPVLLAEEVSRGGKRPRILYRVNPAWAAAQLPGQAPAPLVFDRAALLAEARTLLAGEASR